MLLETGILLSRNKADTTLDAITSYISEVDTAMFAGVLLIRLLIFYFI